ncbi:hypothetical protein ACJMK2_019607 [Sinanodonta woodiana]|uniref:Uncharacterized protein n=1 Tax=Sinanodonta woodiana TaxID=1069815 RepID=A0ABD3TYZ8_SINWO
MAEVNIEKRPSENKSPLLGGHVQPYGSESQWKIVCTKKKVLIIAIVFIMLVLYAVGLTIGLSIGLHNRKSSVSESGRNYSVTQIPVGAVVTDHEACSDVGRDILARGGTAVDAAIAALLCNGLRTPHSMGIGGGCFMVIYDKYKKSAVAIDGREVAPMAATADAFSNLSDYTWGGKMIGVPGELMAYKKAHQLYGRLPWKSLFEPTIKMAEEGHPLGHATAKALASVAPIIKSENYPYFCEMFCKDGRVLKEGETVRMLKLAHFLKGVAEHGPDFMYQNDDVVLELVAEINQAGGIFHYLDFKKYEPKVYPAEEFVIGDYNLYTLRAPSGGPVLELILNVLEGFNITADDISTAESEAELIHKFIETIKFANADKLYLGDPDFAKIDELLQKMKSEDYAAYIRSRIDLDVTHNISYYTNITAQASQSFGTSHVSVLSPYGDAVSVTSTINYYFGSLVVSNSTGIIWNNEMKDFWFKEDQTNRMIFEANKVEPFKRPLSAMVPVILTDKMGDVKVVIGAAGGNRITNAVAQILMRLLWLNQTLAEAMDAKRFSHGLNPNELNYENGMSEVLVDHLKGKGHKIPKSDPFIGVVEGILVTDGQIEAVADPRKRPGKPSYVYADA